MKLKELLRVIKRSQKVSIFDSYGELCEADDVGNLHLIPLMDSINRKVINVFYDSNDNSISIELKDCKYIDEE